MQTSSIEAPILPGPVARYFTHAATDPDAVAACFTDDAVVADEGRAHRGRPAIAAWNRAAQAQYAVTTEVLAAETDVARTTVRAKVSGSFSGSPVVLRFRFTVAGELVSRLEIAP